MEDAGIIVSSTFDEIAGKSTKDEYATGNSAIKKSAKWIKYQFIPIGTGRFRVTVTFKDALVLDAFDIGVHELSDHRLRLGEFKHITPRSVGLGLGDVPSKTTFRTDLLLTWMTERLMMKELIVGVRDY